MSPASSPEQHGTQADERGTFLDGNLEIIAHPHAEMRESHLSLSLHLGSRPVQLPEGVTNEF